MSLFYPSFKSFLLALNLEWKMYFKWEKHFNIINIIHTCTNIYTWRWYAMHSFSKIYKWPFRNRIADFLIYLHIIALKNALKTGVWSCTVQYLIWVELFFLCQTEMSLFWFTLLSNGKDGELFDFFELGDAHFFTQLHYHIFSDLCEAIKITP